MEGRSKGKSLFFILFGEREKKNKNVRKRRHWPRVSATIAWKIWISRNRPGSIKFPTTTIRGICKCLFFLFYLDIVLSRSVRRVKPFPASYATASVYPVPDKKEQAKGPTWKNDVATIHRGIPGLLSLPSFPNRFTATRFQVPRGLRKFEKRREIWRGGKKKKEEKNRERRWEKGEERKKIYPLNIRSSILNELVLSLVKLLLWSRI